MKRNGLRMSKMELNGALGQANGNSSSSNAKHIFITASYRRTMT